MYCTNYIAKYAILMLLITGSLSCAQLPENSASSSPAATENATSKPVLSSGDLNNYKQALYALRDNKPEQAETLLLDIIEKHPNLAGPHANISLIYYQKGQTEKAKKYLEKTIALNPKNSYAYNMLGIIENNKGNFSSAEKHFLLAIKYKKDYAKAHYNIALLYDIYFHELQKSIHHYQKYLSIISNKGIKDKQTADWLKQLESSLKQG